MSDIMSDTSLFLLSGLLMVDFGEHLADVEYHFVNRFVADYNDGSQQNQEAAEKLAKGDRLTKHRHAQNHGRNGFEGSEYGSGGRTDELDGSCGARQ